ncbi:MAG: hypothetical protein AAF662_06840 [Pseudomonadota bacterium]
MNLSELSKRFILMSWVSGLALGIVVVLTTIADELLGNRVVITISLGSMLGALVFAVFGSYLCALESSPEPPGRDPQHFTVFLKTIYTLLIAGTAFAVVYLIDTSSRGLGW